MITKICEICGREFVPRSNSQRSCRSPECLKEINRRYRQNSVDESGIAPKKCAICGTVFQPKRRKQMTCSPKCARKRIAQMSKSRDRKKQMARNGEWADRVCRLCGIAYYGNGEYCSWACEAADFDGSARRPFTEAKGRKLGTADLIRKWHDEGWPAEKIANVLMRDVKQVKEALDNA